MANWEWFTKTHRWVYRKTGGRIGAKLAGTNMLLLTTTGRKSGLERTIPLACYPRGNDLVIVASNNGQDRHPVWWLNLQKNPDVKVRFGREARRMRAREATGEERERLWPWLKEEMPRYDVYEKRTSRLIPVVVLENASS